MNQATYAQSPPPRKAILVIDDNFDMRRALTGIFSFILGIHVYTAADGHEGLQIYQQQQQYIGLILLDMNMPVMNGEQTYAKLQEIAPAVKVIISSSLSKSEIGQRLGGLTMPILLAKPYDTEDLITTVQQAMAL